MTGRTGGGHKRARGGGLRSTGPLPGLRGPAPGEGLPGIGVVTNPRSRQNRLAPRLAARLSALLGGRGEVAHPQDREELLAVARRFQDQGVEVVAVNGGDGTTHTVLTAFMQVYGKAPLPRLALLRGGTMNTIPSGMGIRGSPVRLLARLVARLDERAPIPEVERNLMCVDGEVPQYGFLFGNGLISNFLEAYYEGSEPSPAKAAWVLARGVMSGMVGGAFFRRLMQPLEVEVEVEGAAWPWPSYLAVGAGTVDDIGLGFRPFFRAPENPGRMHVLGLACSPLQVIRELPRIRLARAPLAADIGAALATRMRMRAKRPIAYMIDGDFHVGGEVLDVSVGPRVRILLP